MTHTRRRAGTLVAAFLCLVTAWAWVELKLLSPTADPRDPSSRDLLTYYYPMMRWGFAQLAHGRLPLWNPWQSCGTPFLAIPQVGFLYPLYASFLVLPAATAAKIDVVLHLAIAAFTMFLLCRHFRMQDGPALIAGLIYAYHGGMAVKVHFPNFLAPVAWIPLVFLLVDRLLARPAASTAGLLAVLAAAMMLGAMMQYVYYAVLALAPFLVARASRGTSRRAVELLCAAAGVAMLLALIRIMPAAEYMRSTWRPPGVLSVATAAQASLDPSLLVRNLLGPEPDADFARQAYVGSISLVLAAVGLVFGRDRSATVPMAIAGVAAALYTLGPRGPIFPVLVHLPLGTWFRGPDRALIIVGLAVAFLAGAGLDELLRRRTGTRGRPFAVFVLAAALLAGAALSARVPGAATVAGHAGVATFLVAVVLATRARPARVAAVAALGVLVAAELFHGQRPGGVLPPGDEAYLGRYEPLFATIRARQGHERTFIWAGFATDRRLFFQSDLAKSGLNHGVWHATDYEALCDARFQRYLDFPAPRSPLGAICYAPLVLTREMWHRVRLMGVAFFLVEDGREAEVDPTGTVIASWRLLQRQDGVSLYEDPKPMPRVFVAPEVVVASDEDAVLMRMADVDLERVAIVEEPMAARSPARASGTRDAQIIGYAPEVVTVRARSEDGGLLVLTDRYDPGWKATLDGSAVRIVRTDDIFRGVLLPPGEHVVEFRYRPRSFVVGAVGSAVGVVALGLLLGLQAAQRSRQT